MMFTKIIKDYNVYSNDEIAELKDLEASQSYSEMLDIISMNGFSEVQKKIVFSDVKSLEHHPLNCRISTKRGLHVFRAWVAYEKAKQFTDSNFLEEGICQIKGISRLFHGDPEELAREIRTCPPNIPKYHSNVISNLNSNDYPNARKFLASEDVMCLILRYSPYHEGDIASSINDVMNCYFRNTFLQNLINEPTDKDPQKNLHIDTFFPCLKFWYFPEEVQRDGAFRFAKGSTKLTFPKMKFIYKETNDIVNDCYEDWKRKDHKEGSLRISEKELLYDLKAEAAYITVPADTLVIANVNGFHGRGYTTKRTERPAIHGSIRIYRKS